MRIACRYITLPLSHYGSEIYNSPYVKGLRYHGGRLNALHCKLLLRHIAAKRNRFRLDLASLCGAYSNAWTYLLERLDI